MSPLTAGMNHWLVAREQKEAEVKTRELLESQSSQFLFPKSTSLQNTVQEKRGQDSAPISKDIGLFSFSIQVPTPYPSYLPNPLTSETTSKPPTITPLLIKVVLMRWKSLR